MARIYTNENFPIPAASELKKFGHNVLTSQDAAHSGRAMPDEEVLEFARAQGRILVTLNRKHFIRLHNQTPNHPGIIVCSLDTNFSALAGRIHKALSENPILINQLLRVDRP